MRRKIHISFFLIILIGSLVGNAGSLKIASRIDSQPWGLAYFMKGAQSGGLLASAAFAEGLDADLTDEESKEPSIPALLSEMFEENPDTVGLIQIGGTPIDYPVMQREGDVEYYLDHGFDGRPNKDGLPILDIQSNIWESNAYLIHGHNMKSGRMFATLLKYVDEDFYQDHSRIRFDTLCEEGEYEIFAVVLSEVFDRDDEVFKFYRVEDLWEPSAFAEYVENVKAMALYDTGITARYGDKLIILSTCEYSREDGRLAVIARRIDP